MTTWEKIDIAIALTLPLLLLGRLPSYHLDQCYRSIKLFGWPSRKSIRRMFDLDVMREFNTSAGLPRIHPTKQMLLLLAIGLAVTTVAVLANSKAVLSLGICILGHTIVRFLQTGFPPAVFLMGTSGRDIDELWGQIREAIYPLAVVSLVKPGSFIRGLDFSDPSQRNLLGAFGHRKYGRDPGEEFRNRYSYRTLIDDHWRLVVDSLIEICPIVVIDGRESSSLVREELDRTMTAASTKTFIVTGNWGDCSLVDDGIAGGPEQKLEHQAKRVRKGRLLDFLEQMINAPESIPAACRFGAPTHEILPSTGRSGADHKYTQELLRLWGKSCGSRITTATQPNHNETYDVLLERDGYSIACQILTTTHSEHDLARTVRCLQEGQSEVAVVSTQRKFLREFKAEAMKTGMLDEGRLRLYTTEEFWAMLLEKWLTEEQHA